MNDDDVLLKVIIISWWSMTIGHPGLLVDIMDPSYPFIAISSKSNGFWMIPTRMMKTKYKTQCDID